MKVEQLTIQDLSQGAFAVSSPNPNKVTFGVDIAPRPGTHVAGRTHDSRGAFEVPPQPKDPLPGPVTREDLGQKIDLIA